ncbi:MAG: hypothetical protein WCE63_19735 [Acidobacteriaceae bacterium]
MRLIAARLSGWPCNLKKTIAGLFPLGSMSLKPPTRRVPFLWKNRAAACFLGCPHQVIFRLLPFQRRGQELIDFYRAVGGAMRGANFKHCPISDVQQQNNTDQNGKVSNQPPEAAPDHEGILVRAKVAALQNPPA